MKPLDKKDIINKSTLLNWLYSADKELPLAELGRWIEAKTSGKYSIVKNEQLANNITIAENSNSKKHTNNEINQQTSGERNAQEGIYKSHS